MQSNTEYSIFKRYFCDRCQSLSEEYSSPAKSVVECMTSDPDSNAAWYIMFRAIEKFQMKHGRNPGTHVTQVEADIGRLKVPDLFYKYTI